MYMYSDDICFFFNSSSRKIELNSAERIVGVQGYADCLSPLAPDVVCSVHSKSVVGKSLCNTCHPATSFVYWLTHTP